MICGKRMLHMPMRWHVNYMKGCKHCRMYNSHKRWRVISCSWLCLVRLLIDWWSLTSFISGMKLKMKFVLWPLLIRQKKIFSLCCRQWRIVSDSSLLRIYLNLTIEKAPDLRRHGALVCNFFPWGWEKVYWKQTDWIFTLNTFAR